MTSWTLASRLQKAQGTEMKKKDERLDSLWDKRELTGKILTSCSPLFLPLPALTTLAQSLPNEATPSQQQEWRKKKEEELPPGSSEVTSPSSFSSSYYSDSTLTSQLPKAAPIKVTSNQNVKGKEDEEEEIRGWNQGEEEADVVVVGSANVSDKTKESSKHAMRAADAIAASR